jgi:hypothetical protein
MGDEPEIVKHFEIKQPREINKRTGEEYAYGRDWQLAELEAALWQARAAGGVDDTPIGGVRDVVIKELPAYMIEIPVGLQVPARRVAEEPKPLDLQEPQYDYVGKKREPITRAQALTWATAALVLTVIVPTMAVALVQLYRFLWGELV